MKKILQKLFASPAIRAIKGIKGFFSKGKISSIIRSRGFKRGLQTIGISASASVLASVITRKLTSDDNGGDSRSGYIPAPGFDDVSQGYMIMADQYDKVRAIKENLSLLVDQSTQPRVSQARNQLVCDFVELIGNNLSPDESHRLLQFMETLTCCALAGTYPSEAGNSDTLYRYSINSAENPLSSTEANYRALKVLDVALSGAPLK